MIRHIVLVRLRPEVAEREIAAVLAGLGALRAVLPGMVAFHGGRSDSPEKIERGYLHGFTADFRDAAALAAYQAHPEHRRLGAALTALAEGGRDGILVFDLPMAGAA